MDEANVYIRSINISLVIALVNTWQLDDCPASARFMYIYPCSVEASEVIYYSNHELKRVMCLKIEALETFNSI